MRLRDLIQILALVQLCLLTAWGNPPELPKEFTDALASGAPITLYSLQPRGGPKIPEWDFQGHLVLGHVDLNAKQSKVAAGALNDALTAGDADSMAMCLINPRHAFRFKWKGNTYDVLICYQCGQLELFKNDSRMQFRGSIAGKPDVLNGLLKAAAIPLADVPAVLDASYSAEAKMALEHAENGDAKAQDVIGRMLLVGGRGIKKDEAEGIKWLAKASKLSPDDADFEVKLGNIYSYGWDGEDRNFPAAITWYRKAAAQGSAEGLYKVGYLYDTGEGVTQNAAEAMKWFIQSAEKGNAKAEFDLGVRYAQGRDMKLDYSEGLKWLKKAAEQCHPEALHWMGVMYDKGWGVAKDPIEAYFWDKLAKSYHTIFGSDLSVKLTPKERTAVDKRVSDWIEAHPAGASKWERY